MTNREKEVLELIKENPLISQLDCSKKLGISRSAIAGHIMNLTIKGHIKGKGYILQDEPYAVVIGGSNIDILGTPDTRFISRDSNPGKVSVSAGGVGRNIAENLSRMNCSVKLLSILGSDLYGEQLLSDSRSAGVDMNQVSIREDESTSTYLAVLDEKKDMIAAISSMSIMDRFDRKYIDANNRIILSASLLILDANLPSEILQYITRKYSDKTIFIDTVSTSKAEKVKDIIGCFHTIKPNLIEAEILSGIKINTVEDMKRASGVLIKKGVSRVFLTRGKEGILYTDKDKSLTHKIRAVEAVNMSGAGDAFTAALAYSYMNNLSTTETLNFASAAGAMTVMHQKTINPDLSVNNIKKMIKENIENVK